MKSFIKLCVTSAFALSLGISAQGATIYGLIQSGDGLTTTDLVNNGWTILYDDVYADHTSVADVQAWQAAAGSGYILMAGTDSQGNVLLGATGLASEVLSPTFSKSQAVSYSSSPMYWYNYSDWSIGFADTSTIVLNSADIAGGDLRLSWHLHGWVGGYRVGNITGLNSNTSYRKLVMMAPAAVPEISSTLALFGLGIAGLSLARRKIA